MKGLQDHQGSELADVSVGRVAPSCAPRCILRTALLHQTLRKLTQLKLGCRKATVGAAAAVAVAAGQLGSGVRSTEGAA